ncbi:reverse transcriptase, partial [Lasius niger]
MLLQRRLPEPIIIAGDFNAHSRHWGPRRTNHKGRVLEDRAAVLGLCILNIGTSSTLVRPQGESIDNLTWASPFAADRKLDKDRLEAAVLSATWPDVDTPQDIEGQVEWLGNTMTRACDFAMPRAKPRPRRAAFLVTIRRAKARAWDQQLLALDSDPWRRLYNIVMSKIKQWAPPVTKSLDPQVLEETLSTLFSEVNRAPELFVREPADWEEYYEVSRDEMTGVIKSLGKSQRSPYSKGGRPAGTPSSYRPICLLDEIGKLLERIIANRLVYHLKRVGPDLHEEQYGFRKGRSTTDAIFRVRFLVGSFTSEGGVVVAISLDIVYAFNTLPWGKVRDALIQHDVPLVEVVKSYFQKRGLEYRDRHGTKRERKMYCGVPQGAIKSMGLKVTPRKTEAIYFHDGSRGVPPQTHVTVDIPVQLGTCMKYLGLWLDGRWSFRDHFDRLVGKVESEFGGPLRAPVWVDKAVATKHIRDALRRVQRRVAIHVVRGYRTVSHAAASTLAGLPPMELVAGAQAKVYRQLKELQSMGDIITNRTGCRGREVHTGGMDGRHHGRMSFHLTQVLVGHGCFGEYLHKIGKELTAQCHHCDEKRDTAQHTLEFCPAWAEERRALTDKV